MFSESKIPVIKKEIKNLKIKYPYKNMDIGDCVELKEIDVGVIGIHKARKYAHNYASSTRKKFRTLKEDGTLKVWRVK